MKRLLLLLMTSMMASYAMAATVTVTLTTDDVASPTIGMLRYYIKNATSGDIIKFAVNKVNLAGEIALADKNITLDGTDMGKVTIDGGALVRIFNITQYSRSSKTYFKNLILQNGKAIKDGGANIGWGGAAYIYIKAFGGLVEFDQCIFQSNEAYSNSDGQGGAVRCDGGLFKNCQFLNNKVTGTAYANTGGAVQALGGAFINCLFSGNSAKHGGGAYIAGDASFFNCTFSQNQSSEANEGGGIFCESTSLTVNCIAYGNTAAGAVNNVVSITYNGETGTFKNCAFENGNSLVGTNGNIGLAASPFVGSGSFPFALAQGTACINAGTTAGITVLSNDIAGNTRIQGTIDMGAYESSFATKVDNNQAKRAMVLYPNPSSGLLYFSGELGNETTVRIFDATGKTIIEKHIVDKLSPIDLTGYKGIFIAVVENGGNVITEKIVVK